MNRIRTVKPEMRRNRKIADCGVLASLLSRDLITYADDQGRFRGSAREIKAEIFPYFDSLKLSEVEDSLLALADVGFIELYVVTETGTASYKTPPEGWKEARKSVPGRTPERFGWMPGWFKHQQLKADRITWSELPPPPGFDPTTMSRSLHEKWMRDAAENALPRTGDGLLVAPQVLQPVSGPEPDVSKLETERNQGGAEPDPRGDISEPRARGRTGADRTGPDRTGPGTEQSTPPSPPAGEVREEKKPPGPPMSPEAVALIHGYQELGYARPSATDQIRAAEYVTELTCLTVPQMLDRMWEHLAWCEQHKKPRPGSLAGFWNTLRAENDYRRDNGARPRDQPPSSEPGKARIGDLLPESPP